MKARKVNSSQSKLLSKSQFETPSKLPNSNVHSAKSINSLNNSKNPIRMSIKLQDIIYSCKKKSLPQQHSDVLEPEIEEFIECKKNSINELSLKKIPTKKIEKNQQRIKIEKKTQQSSCNVRIKEKYIKKKYIQCDLKEKNFNNESIENIVTNEFGYKIKINENKRIEELPDSVIIIIDGSAQIYSLKKILP